jgi:hypothetical protein
MDRQLGANKARNLLAGAGVYYLIAYINTVLWHPPSGMRLKLAVVGIRNEHPYLGAVQCAVDGGMVINVGLLLD